MYKLLGSIAAILVLLGVAAISIWFEWVRNIFAPIGAILSAAIIYYFISPQKAKIIASDIARLVGFLSGGVRRFTVKNKVEAYINTVMNEFDNACKGATQYPMKLVWVTKEVVPRSYIERERVIVRLRYKDPAYLNVVASATAYCRAGLLPDTRQYIHKPLARAIDLEVVDTILNRNKMREGQRYFRSQVLPSEFQKYEDIQPWFDILRDLEDQGHFRRILLPELVRYPIKARYEVSNTSHPNEINNFVYFLRDIAASLPGGEVNLDYIGRRLQVGVIIVGMPKKLQLKGHVPYLSQIELCRDRGAEVIYLIGVKGASREIPGIAREAEYLGLVNIIDLRRLPKVKWRDGTVVPAHYAQLEVKPAG